MRINTPKSCLHLAILILAGAATAAAQGFSVPSGRVTNFVDWAESFEGSTGSSGQDMVLNTSVTYHISRYSIGLGLPLYLDRSVGTDAAAFSVGRGDAYLKLGSSWNSPLFDYDMTLTGGAPTGDPSKGFGTGHITFDWNNHLDHEFADMTVFVNAGVANTLSDTLFFHRPFTSYGDLAHLEAGADVGLPHKLTLVVSGYEIAPWGTQTIISRDVVAGATGTGGQDGRVFEVNHLTIGPAFMNHDDGATLGFTYNPKPYLNLAVGYTRSISFAFNSISWGIGVDMSRLIGGGKSTR